MNVKVIEKMFNKFILLKVPSMGGDLGEALYRSTICLSLSSLIKINSRIVKVINEDPP